MKKPEDSFSYKISNDSLITIDKSDSNSVYYYAIQNLDSKYFSLLYLGRGNMLIFRRKINKK